MSALVTYFSRTGNTAELARQIATRLGAEEEPIVERDPRTGALGTAIGAIRAALGWASTVNGPQNDPAAYDLVLIGTPVWAGAPAPAVNAWIDAHRDGCKQVAFFATMGGTGADRTFSHMKKRMAKDPIACLAVTEDQFGNAEIDEKLDQFISDIKSRQR